MKLEGLRAIGYGRAPAPNIVGLAFVAIGAFSVGWVVCGFLSLVWCDLVARFVR